LRKLLILICSLPLLAQKPTLPQRISAQSTVFVGMGSMASYPRSFPEKVELTESIPILTTSPQVESSGTNKPPSRFRLPFKDALLSITYIRDRLGQQIGITFQFKKGRRE